MATKRFCDCGCGMELTEHDAGRLPLIYRSKRGIVLQVQVLAGPRSETPNIRAGCVRKMVSEAELLFPDLAKVEDAAAEEREKPPIAFGEAQRQKREGA